MKLFKDLVWIYLGSKWDLIVKAVKVKYMIGILVEFEFSFLYSTSLLNLKGKFQAYYSLSYGV